MSSSRGGSEASRGSFHVMVERGDARQRLDRFLTALGVCGTRSQVQRMIADGSVRVDGNVTKPGALLRCGQRIDVIPAVPRAASTVEPEAIPLSVLYEDDWLLIIDKPAGLVVHPAPGHWQGTVVGALLHRWQGRPADLDPLRPGIVHRLDKDTSGVLVIAKDATTLAELGRQFRAREVTKEYLALVWGELRERQGEVRRPIGRHPVHRKRMSVRAGGREAVTRYRVLGESQGVSVLRVVPETGRTHQIRVHLAALGHPILGDHVYGGGTRRAGDLGLHRQALHAVSLALRHPRTGAPLCVVAPVPDDIRQLLDKLGLSRLTTRGASSSVLPRYAPSPSGSRHRTHLGTARSSHRAPPN